MAAAAVLLVTAMAALVVNDALVSMEKDRTEQQRRLAVDNFRKADEQRRIAEDLSAKLTLDRGLALCERGEVSRGLLWLTRAPGNRTVRRDGASGNRVRQYRELAAPVDLAARHPAAPGRSRRGRCLRLGGQVVPLLAPNVRSEDDFCAALELVHAATAGAGSAIHRSYQPVQPRCTRARCQTVEPRPHLDPGRGRRFGRTAVGHCHGPACWAASAVCRRDHLRGLQPGREASCLWWRRQCGASVRCDDRGRDRSRACGTKTRSGSVVYSPDGKTILTGSHDRTARLWDAATGKALGSPFRHADPVNRVAYRPDGKTIATGDLGGVVRLWDVDQGAAHRCAHDAPASRHHARLQS